MPPVRGQVTYFVALHEIGHLVGPGRSGTRLEKEAAAWRFALHAALVEPTDACRRRIGRRLRSYVTWAEARQHRRRPPVLPPPESPFWPLLRVPRGLAAMAAIWRVRYSPALESRQAISEVGGIT